MKIAFGFLFFAFSAQAGTITKSYTFTDGTTASATQVNANFDQLFTEINSKETRITTIEGAWTKSGSSVYYNSGNVGIGTSSPVKFLDIRPAGNVQANLGLASTGGAGAKIYFGTGGLYDGSGGDDAGAIAFNAAVSGGFEFRTNSGVGDVDTSAKTKVTILSNGRVGIGTITPGYLLDVQGGGINASGAYTNVSDRRLKTDVQPLADSLEKVLRLQGVSFHWIDRARYGSDPQIGLIAQELEKVFPELVKTNAQGFKSVNYPGLVMPTIEAVKTLNRKIEEQGTELESVKHENNELKQKLQALGDYLCRQNPAAGFCGN